MEVFPAWSKKTQVVDKATIELPDFFFFYGVLQYEKYTKLRRSSFDTIQWKNHKRGDGNNFS